MAVRSANVNVRIDPNIKIQAAAILKVLGVSESTFIDMAYRQLILQKGIPFSVQIPNKIISREEMNTNVFNTMISEGIKQAENGESLQVNEAINGILEKLE